jgi:ATP synthase protein I
MRAASMPSDHTHSGDLSQNSGGSSAHHIPVQTPVQAERHDTLEPAARAAQAPATAPATLGRVSGAARSGRQFYHALSASSVGLELGLSVVVGVLIGRWLDGRFGTEPWLMLAFLVLGLVAGFRGVLRAVRRADRAAEAEEAEARHG